LHKNIDFPPHFEDASVLAISIDCFPLYRCAMAAIEYVFAVNLSSPMAIDNN
jgi:hypothetical protein